MALWLIAPDNDDLDQNWEEASEEGVVWPSTRATEWCGEWTTRTEGV